MIRSRRLVLVAAVAALGLSACGNPNTTTPVADQPQVIRLAGSQSGSGAAVPAAADSANASTESKIAIMAPTTFVYDGELPALDGQGGSWFFAPGQKPDIDRIAKLAAALGVQGDVRTLPVEQGGGWAVGPEDYSAAVLTIGSDGMLSWYLSAGQPTVTSIGGCAVASGVAIEPALGAPGVVDAVPPAGTVPAPAEPADTPLATDGVAPDVVAPDCPVPNPPVGVPTKDEAMAKAKQMFADWGYDISSFQFDDAYADEWGASVNASLVLEGLKAPVMLSVGFGENGTVTYASGYLATPVRGADYPTIGAAAGLERLKAQNQFGGGLGGPGVMEATGNAAASGAAPDVAPVSDTATGIASTVEPSVVPCEPEAASVDCSPVGIDSITVTLNSVRPDLTMVWAADNTIWLLPAYTFGSVDGGLYTVNAVDDAYIQQADPGPVTTEPVIKPGLPVPVPDTAPAADGGASNTGTVPDTTG
ncbi:MAG: hypothetical protein QOH53_759 [Ilumatobacteraceae bacterium]|jgi:hypothetical protein